MPNPRSTGTISTMLPPPPTDSDLQKLKQSSYLLSYLSKSHRFTDTTTETTTTTTTTDSEAEDIPIPASLLDFTRNLAAATLPKTHINIRSEHTGNATTGGMGYKYKIHSGDDDEYNYQDGGEDIDIDMTVHHENINTNTNTKVHTTTNTNTSYLGGGQIETDEEDGEKEEEKEEEYYDESESESEVDPDELTNLPYKSPAVYKLPGSGNGNKFRTLVRDGPLGSVQGENQRFVVIGKRSFRGAGLWPGRLVGVDVDVDLEMEMEMDGGDVDNDEEEEVGLEGEVEVMWSDDGEEFWLVRDPVEDGGIGRNTSWVSKDWFARRRRRVLSRHATGHDDYDNKERVELRVTMEED
ncbi:hypothetical protein AA313_de0200242 [Arthrobotrys entomopaga]|nr:hypothetical protein AA313_de0200242 [Arthrobotrys entomopaga]